jgi:hypothetical protein
LKAALTEFGFKPFKKRKVELLDMLNMFLIEQYSNGKKVVLIVDEAQNLSKKVLEEIRMLSGIETHKEKVLRIILAGQPELKETLESPELKQLVQRVRLRFHIESLDLREMHEYIEHRLTIAGRKVPGPFIENAYPKIFLYSGGIPRLINTLCDTAMLCAFADEKTTIDVDDIMAAVEELNWKEQESATGRYRELPKISIKVPEISHLTKIELRVKGKFLSEHFFGSGRVIIGRSPDNEIDVESPFVSRRHAQITSDKLGSTIEDLNSTNGILINDKRVKKHRLHDGDVVAIGFHQLVYTDLREAGKIDGKKSSASGK